MYQPKEVKLLLNRPNSILAKMRLAGITYGQNMVHLVFSTIKVYC